MGAPRSQHKAFAFNYIAKFSQQEKGTGGSNFMVRELWHYYGEFVGDIGGWS